MSGSQQIDFFDSGYSYGGQDDSSSYGYAPPDQGGNYGDYYGGYDQSYNSAPGYGNQGPTMMTPQQNNYSFNDQMKQGPSAYTNFEDEPPLLEGIAIC